MALNVQYGNGANLTVPVPNEYEKLLMDDCVCLI